MSVAAREQHRHCDEQYRNPQGHRGPCRHDGSRQLCNREFSFIVHGPGLISIVISKDRQDQHSLFCIDGGNIVTNVILCACLVGDRRVRIRIHRFEIARNAASIELIAQHMEHDSQSF